MFGYDDKELRAEIAGLRAIAIRQQEYIDRLTRESDATGETLTSVRAFATEVREKLQAHGRLLDHNAAACNKFFEDTARKMEAVERLPEKAIDALISGLEDAKNEIYET